jgi:hypothetical protein
VVEAVEVALDALLKQLEDVEAEELAGNDQEE